MRKKILFVCTGNTCRSSMAEYLFRHLVKERGFATERGHDLIIRSAGVFAIEKDPAADQAIEVLKKRGLMAIADHQATPVNEDLILDADLILTMTKSHKAHLLNLYPEAKSKIFTLKEFTITKEEQDDLEFDLDIKDPFGQSVEAYQITATEIETYLQRLLEKI